MGCEVADISDIFFGADYLHMSDIPCGGDIFMSGLDLPGTSFPGAHPLKLVAKGKRTIIDGQCNGPFKGVLDQGQGGQFALQDGNRRAADKCLSPDY